jgi:protein-disulfide isomerase
MVQGSQRGNRWWSVIVPGVLSSIFTVAMSISQTAATKPPEIYLAGQSGASVKIEVFSDYQCPICRTYYLETLKPLIYDYTKANKIDRISVVYHDLPLESIHQNARKAARLALAAHRMGKDKWLKVSDALYMQQAVWSEDGNCEAPLEKILEPAELIQLKKMAADPSIETVLNQEIGLAQSRNITSTPTTFIITETGRQQRFTGDPGFAALKDYLDKMIK